ncbi:nucleoside-diphosphate sugar epimerase/dehydratase [Devosia sp. Leaf64]|uniref:polysaccharide biosynthesis protein n=1 Tax=Devosia sp. Leaf64 TaxID=1736229 RepID=UPI00071580D5|nr:nucleoside-diphosphate sugar epimerase/dehydratase [Devosia sp. Leaf64]KQN74817.1 capsular biosynthesis protein [Devosia sp. Leaf64]
MPISSLTLHNKQKLIAWLGSLPRFSKRVIIVAFDVLALSFALWASFSLRFGSWTPPNTIGQFVMIGSAPLVAIPIFARLGLYRAVIRYLPERALWSILQATSLAAGCWLLLVFLSAMSGYTIVPRSVPILYWAIATMLIGSSRFLVKRFLWSSRTTQAKHRQILVYGAGESGAQLVTALRRNGGDRIVGFIDDNSSLHGRDVAGIRVFPLSHFERLVEQHGIDEVILSIPSLTSQRKQEIIARVSGQGVKIKTLPPISELVSGKYLVSQIRDIEIDELLGRSTVPADRALVREIIEGRTIMVTGAGGSIGSELCRLIAQWSPQRLVLFESNEFALYRIDRELTAAYDHAIVPILGSVVDRRRLESAIDAFGVQVLFHAAAYKHVPLVEANALEGIRNNVLGTLNAAETALSKGVEHFVLISSDKAVRPTNVMGATKRWAELIIQDTSARALARQTGQRFSAVRFGNVLGSNGSVVPLFKEQIAAGGPLTLTDPGMTRYFMSIREAAELIVQAGQLSQGGDIFLLEMGSPVLISDLAENMIRLAGFSVRNADNPEGDIEIVVTGKRPGEKMYEELFYNEADAAPTGHPKIMRATHQAAINLEEWMLRLKEAVDTENESDARRILFEAIR